MLGLRFSRLVRAALAGGGLTLTGCPGGGQDTDTDTDTDTDGTDTDDPTTTATTVNPTTDPPPPPPPPDLTPPALVGIEFLDPQILRLTFTEAIAPVEDVNPKRFRLSVGRYILDNYYGDYSRTVYIDPEPYNRSQSCGEVCDEYYYCYYQCYYGPPTAIDVLDVLPDAYNPAQAVLLLGQPVFPQLCLVVNSLGSPERPGGLLLHYADGGASQITDLVGLPLAASGKTWVIKSDYTYSYVADLAFPEQNPLLPIPCPF